MPKAIGVEVEGSIDALTICVEPIPAPHAVHQERWKVGRARKQRDEKGDFLGSADMSVR